MRSLAALLLGALVAVEAVSSGLVVHNGAICENKATGFFVMDNTDIKSEDSIVYRDFAEDDCMKTCSQNRDTFGRSILCSSFVYDPASLTCTVYKAKTAPEGNATATSVVGKKYFEKVCLNDQVPIHCADAQFIRADDSILIGSATVAVVLDTLEECVGYCTSNSTCKSAMYFYNDGECIINSESALTTPKQFQKEEEDKVIYFQNGCPNNLQIDPTTQETTSTETVSEEDIQEGSAVLSSETTSAETTEHFEVTDESHEDITETKSTESTEPTTTVKSNDDSDEYSTIASETAEEYEDGEYEDSQEEYDDEKSLQQEEEELEKERRKVKKLAEKAGYVKFKEHPRNFASKTHKGKNAKVALPNDTEEDTEVETEVETLSSEENSEPTEAETKPLKKKKKPVKQMVSSSTEGSSESQGYPNYFSDWSDWTPCTKSGERQIRRRKCLDLRRCLGALMQVRSCPAVLTTIPPVIESVRSLVAVPPVDYDDVQVNPPVEIVRQHPSSLPNSEVSSVWSEWQGTCQQFASGQPCSAGRMIGFESRECIAKDPSFCEGPFFRYCTLPC